MPVTAARREQRPGPDRQPGRERAEAVDQNRAISSVAAEAIRHRAADEAADRRERERLAGSTATSFGVSADPFTLDVTMAR